MPYIPQARRRTILDCPVTSGELNYVLTKTILRYLEDRGRCYQTMNDIVGALEGAKQEFNRRVVAPYEDVKCVENGDVY